MAKHFIFKNTVRDPGVLSVCARKVGRLSISFQRTLSRIQQCDIFVLLCAR